MTWTLLALTMLGAPQNPVAPVGQLFQSGDTNRYEGLYGKPEFWSLELLTPLVGEATQDVPRNKAIRTQGKLVVVMRPIPSPHRASSAWRSSFTACPSRTRSPRSATPSP